MKIETEEKYYCLNPNDLIKIAENLKFKRVKEEEETDEYFTDIDGNFIKNRTCLRIRKQNNKKMEITYKGKSDSLLGLFCKLENNISADINDYYNYVNLFSSLGYYSYVKVEKKRIVYELNTKKYKYSIMLDTLSEIGGFVEFEIISEQSKSTKNTLKKELSDFVSKFSELKLKEAKEPYRDIVANHLLKKLKITENTINICLNLDAELLKHEKDFYKKNKKQISKKCGYNISWTEYKKNNKIRDIVKPYILDYINNLILDSKEILVSINLLNKLPYKKLFFTKANKEFCICFFEKLNIKDLNILFIDNSESTINVLKKNNISINNSIIINNPQFKENNSLMLIILYGKQYYKN